MKIQTFVLFVLMLFIIPSDLWATPHWQMMDSPVTQNLNAVWGRSRSDIYAVGNNGVILHYNGIDWKIQIASNQSSPIQNDLHAIWGNDTDIYIAGDDGLILKRDSQIWIPETLESITEDLLDIWGLTDTEVIAVGKKGTIIRKMSENWDKMPSRTLATLNGVWGSDGNAYACGSGGKMLQFNGSQWSVLPGQTFNTLNAVWGQPDQYFYMVGTSGVILKYQSGAWTETIYDSFYSLNAVWGFPNGKIYAGGYRGTILFHDSERPEWTPMDTPADCHHLSVLDIWGGSSQDVYAVGEEGLILYLKQRLMLDGPLELNEKDQSATYQIQLVYALNDNLEVTLQSSDPDTIAVTDVNIPAGNKTWSFDVGIGNDKSINGNSNVTLTASAENWYSSNLQILVVDNETKNLSLTINPQLYSEGAGNVENIGQVSISGSYTEHLSIYLTSDKPEKVIVPDTVEIEAGELTQVFNITIVDNEIRDGLVPIIITAAAPGWQSMTQSLTIADDEGAQLTVTIFEKKAVENQGLIKEAGKVTFASELSEDVTISLRSSNADLVEVTPNTLTVLAGSTEGKFTLFINDNDRISGSQPVQIEAEALKWITGTDTIIITDNDPRNLSLTLQQHTASESIGSLTAQVEIPGTYESDLTIEILNAFPNVLETPPFVILKAGKRSAGFILSIIDNTIITDETEQSVTLSAVAPGWLTHTAQMSILDDEKKELELWVVGNVSEADSLSNAGTIFIPGTYHQSLEIFLDASNTDLVSIPDQITIVAGAKKQSFDMKLINNDEIEGQQTVIITATASGWQSITGLTVVADDETKEIFLVIPPRASENDDTLTNAGKIQITGTYSEDLEIELSLDKTDQVEIPKTLIIEEGSTNTKFDITIIDNLMIDLRQEVTISAKVISEDGWQPDESLIIIDDNEPKKLMISLPDNVKEGAGLYSNMGTVEIPGPYIYDLPIFLKSSNSTMIAPPETIVLPKGYTHISFDCQIMDNNEINLQKTVDVTAFTPEWSYTKDTATTEIIDDESYTLFLQVPNQFTEGTGRLDNVAWIITNGLIPTDLSLIIESSSQTDLSTPSQITLTEWTSATAFPITINDNSAIDSDYRMLSLTIRPKDMADEWKPITALVNIIDDEKKTLSLSTPYTFSEGAGRIESAGKITIPGHMSIPLPINLAVQPDTDISIPEWITIAIGDTQAHFDIIVNENNRIEGPQSIEINALVHLSGWTKASRQSVLTDNDIADLNLTIPQFAVENAGQLKSGVIDISGILANDLQVQLMSNDPSIVAVPEYVSVPSGKTSTSFILTILDNYWITGEQSVEIYAYAPSFPSAHSQIIIGDNETPKLTVWLPDQANIGDGQLKDAGMISLDGLYPEDLEIQMLSSHPDIVSIYGMQVLPVGQNLIFFDLSIADVMSSTISQRVTIFVSADQCIGDSDIIRIKNIHAPANGDFNYDNIIDLTDLILGLQIMTNIEHKDAVHAEVNQNGVVDMGDILNLFDKLVKGEVIIAR